MRTFVIGDIHGAHKALVQCLERCGIDRENDRLITLGDICDGWPEVRQCVDELLTIKNRIDVLGNHDEWLRRWLTTGRHPDNWTQGGNGTICSYDTRGDYWPNPEDVPASHWKFFMHQRLYYADKENRCFVHGGFDRTLLLEDQAHETPMTLYWDRNLWDDAKEFKSEGVLDTADGFAEIFIGHTAVREAKPLYFSGVWNLDTGAGWKGKLTIMDVDTHEYWQSDLVPSLYPDERHGR
jgi:serine/threonine protein phosphatase 1